MNIVITVQDIVAGAFLLAAGGLIGWIWLRSWWDKRKQKKELF